MRWVPAFLMMVVIFAFSSIPANRFPDLNIFDTLITKAGHFIGYGLLFFSYVYWFGKVDSRSLIISLIFVVLYAITDEVHQTVVDGRFGSIWDVVIDLFGAMTAMSITVKTKLFRKS